MVIQLLQLPLEHGPAAEACSHVLLLLVVIEQLRCGEGEKTHGGAEERPRWVHVMEAMGCVRRIAYMNAKE